MPEGRKVIIVTNTATTQALSQWIVEGPPASPLITALLGALISNVRAIADTADFQSLDIEAKTDWLSAVDALGRQFNLEIDQDALCQERGRLDEEREAYDRDHGIIWGDVEPEGKDWLSNSLSERGGAPPPPETERSTEQRW